MTAQPLGSFTEEVIARNAAAQYGQGDADMRVTPDAALHEAELAGLRRGFAKIAAAGEIITADGEGR